MRNSKQPNTICRRTGLVERAPVPVDSAAGTEVRPASSVAAFLARSWATKRYTPMVTTGIRTQGSRYAEVERGVRGELPRGPENHRAEREEEGGYRARRLAEVFPPEPPDQRYHDDGRNRGRQPRGQLAAAEETIRSRRGPIDQ